MKTLILDNYDSFTYNLMQYVGSFGGEVVVERNDFVPVETCDSHVSTQHEDVSHIIISPGPGNPYTPRDIGVSEALIDYAVEHRIPLLGVCLGHQVLGKHFGSTVSRAPEAFHGKASSISITKPESVLFQGMENHCDVMRYHSLHVETVPENFILTAQTDDGIIMAMEHQSLPLFGIQFHPESIGTPSGMKMLENFLQSCS